MRLVLLIVVVAACYRTVDSDDNVQEVISGTKMFSTNFFKVKVTYRLPHPKITVYLLPQDETTCPPGGLDQLATSSKTTVGFGQRSNSKPIAFQPYVCIKWLERGSLPLNQLKIVDAILERLDFVRFQPNPTENQLPKLETVAKSSRNNLVCTPISAYMVLFMATSGARESTEMELRSILGFSKNDLLPTTGFQAFFNNLTEKRMGVELHFANRIYLADDIKIQSRFTTLMKEVFHSELGRVNFYHSVAATTNINNWVANQTKNHIKDLFKSDVLTGDTRLVLVNAVYFEGYWASPFNVAMTKDRLFYVGGTHMTKNISTMHSRKPRHYGELHEVGAKFVQLDFTHSLVEEKSRNSIKIFIILPDARDGLFELISNLEKIDIAKLFLEGPPGKTVNLYLPKFKIESDLDLNEPLKEMGLTRMFSDKANFEGIANETLLVSKIVQKAFIKINEDGAKAGAATGMGIMMRSLELRLPIVEFNADHPFLVIIASKLYRVPLFFASFTGHE